MIDIVMSNHFKKDLKLAKKRGFDMKLLDEVVTTLAFGNKLPSHYTQHDLLGNYVGFKECHIKPDWLLIYKIENSQLELFLFRTGTRADLFD